MKKISIEIAVDEKTGKIATIWSAKGYSRSNIHDQLELVGLLENTKNLISDKINTLASKNLDNLKEKKDDR